MGKTFILGDSSLQDFADEQGFEFIPFPERRPSSHEEIHDFMVDSFEGKDIESIVLDTESDLAFCLDLSMHIRLSLDILGLNSLSPIVFISELAMDSLLKLNQNSQIFLTSNVYLSPASSLLECIGNVSRMRLEDYQSCFLNKITISPPLSSMNERHGLANQWGAGVVYRLLNGKRYEGRECPELVKKQKDLYFKYILACTVDDIQTLAIPEKRVNLDNPLPIMSKGRKILLIDDMADAGWSLVIRQFFQDAEVDVIAEKEILNFEDFSPSARHMIDYGDYDLYLLDLRLGGDKEEDIYDTSSFSGMKVLKRIKNENRGRQVIMFTASNKAWNFKRLLDVNAGANGYYIKESPSFKFSESFSKKSLTSFREEAINCFKRDYLKGLYAFWNTYFPSEGEVGSGNGLFDECGFQVQMAFNLVDVATTDEQFQYAFISLFQVFEILSKYILNLKEGENEMLSMSMKTMDEMAIETVKNIHPDPMNNMLYVQEEHVIFSKKKSDGFSQFEKQASIYLQYLKQKDTGLLYILDQLIKNRNRVMHGTKAEQRNADAKSSVVSAKRFEERYLSYLPIFKDAKAERLKEEFLDGELLREYKNTLIISKDIVNYPIGIKLVLFCLESFFNSFR